MKRCPECRRDYYDDSLRYCLDDGSVLLDGPAASDAATVILPGPGLNAATASASVKGGDLAWQTAEFSSASQEFTRGHIIGRDKQIVELVDLLSDPTTRLVTLTGAGGTGKTRLALEAAHRIRTRFADGVYFIDLAYLNDPSLVIPTISHALTVTEADPRSSFEALLDRLRGRQMLLVLDNFEQVIDAGIQIAHLLRPSPGVQLLVTSREPLRISVEFEYPVPPMSVPATGADEGPSSLLRYEAVELFVERAKQSRPDFELNEENAASVAAICGKLDGLPLALELAAARARVLSPAEILAKLENRLDLLTGGSRDLPGRQQTMRAAIEWSYELLSENEKDVFAGLSVFRGGFNYAEADKVISQTERKSSSESDVELLDVITSLNEKSLLITDSGKGNSPRFQMLEVVRDYASDVLAARGDAETMSRAHAKYFLDLTEEGEPHLRSNDSADWFNRLEQENDNIRAAIAWSIGNDLRTAARIAASMRNLWVTHGHIREGKHWLEEISRSKADLPPELRWKLLTALGNMNQFQGNPEAARNIYLEALEESRRFGDQRCIAQSLRGIAAIDYIQLNFSSASQRINEALEISGSINDEFGTAAALARLGDIAAAQGNASESRRRTGEALELFKRLGYKQGVAAKGSNLGAAEYLDGDIESARLHMLESLQTGLEVGDEIDTRNVFDGFAALALERTDLVNAARLAGAAEARGEAIGYTLEPAERLFREYYIDRIRAEMSETDFEEACAEGRKMKVAEAVALAFAVSR